MNNAKEPLYSQSYIDQGEGDTVILLHGLFGKITMWRNTINALQDKFRIIIPRLPFFDDSIFRTNIRHLVTVLHEFIDWHQLTDVTLVGTDIGGQVAMCYANSYPERVKKIVLSGSSGLFENLPAWDNGFRNVDEQVKRAFFKDEFATFNVIKDVYNTVNTEIKKLHIKFFTQSSQETDVSSFLTTLKMPVLLVWGLQDKITPPEVALHFHDLLPNGQVKFIDECGHFPMIEKPDAYTHHVRLFLISEG